MNLLQSFTSTLHQHKLSAEKDRLLLAVSGGLDSSVLCALCHQAGYAFAIAHCNFQLRGAESDRDEVFVKNVGNNYNVDVHVQKFDTAVYATDRKISIQEAARVLRYEWFAQLADEHAFTCTLLAHHADDNIETLLMNFFRGTGLQGLTGIPQEHTGKNMLLRPMLSFRRQQILEFATTNQLKWVEDSSNESSKYTRNFFRNELLPAIKKVYPQVEDNLLDNIDRFRKVQALYQPAVEQLKSKVVVQHLNEVRLPVKKIKQYQGTSLLYEIIKEYGFSEKQTTEVFKLTDAASGKFVANERFQIIRHGLWLIIAPVIAAAETIAIDKGVQQVDFVGGTLDLQTIAQDIFTLNTQPQVAQLDARHMQYPLLLRKWKTGDYFYPLGMRKKKKLSRFFIDQKLAKNQKENMWVIESNKKILWVVGMRIDDRFKITEATEQVLQLTISNP
jgi:tRNA(Ile)-lysidine synthase